MSEEKKEQTRGEQLRKALLYEKKNGYDRLVPGELEAMEAYCTGYKQFLDAGKTERECVDRTIALAEQAGFRPYIRGTELKPGDKVYRANRGKAIMLAVIGGSAIGMTSLVFYVLVYMAANLAVFGVLSAVEQHSGGRVSLEDYNGFSRTNPRLALLMTLALDRKSVV